MALITVDLSVLDALSHAVGRATRGGGLEGHHKAATLGVRDAVGSATEILNRQVFERLVVAVRDTGLDDGLPEGWSDAATWPSADRLGDMILNLHGLVGWRKVLVHARDSVAAEVEAGENTEADTVAVDAADLRDALSVIDDVKAAMEPYPEMADTLKRLGVAVGYFS